VLTGAVGFSSKRSLIEKFAATGPVPGSGAKAPESGAGRSQHRILGGAAAENFALLRSRLFATRSKSIVGNSYFILKVLFLGSKSIT